MNDWERAAWERIRGPVTWPDWRKAVPGKTRVRYNRSGWTGTVARVFVPRHQHGYVTVLWDETGSIGNVTAPAYDLTAIE